MPDRAVNAAICGVHDSNTDIILLKGKGVSSWIKLCLIIPKAFVKHINFKTKLLKELKENARPMHCLPFHQSVNLFGIIK